MPDQPEQFAGHLNSHHRDTLAQLFAHPTSRNLRWVDVISLLNAVGEAEEKSEGRLRVTVGKETEVFERNHHKDVSIDQIADLRRMMRHFGLVSQFGIVDHHANGQAMGETA